MIGHLEGKLRHKAPDHIVVDVHGVGYVVQVPLSTFYDLPPPGQTVSLHIHTHVRDDAIQLFGFRTASEREMFLYLVTVNGVGPRLAVNILSGISPDELRRVVGHNDLSRLRNIPGIGKKIAERILLELRDRLKIQKDVDIEPSVVCVDEGYSDAFSALINLGYRPSEAQKALTRVVQSLGEGHPVEKLLKEALRQLA
jgi:Holliday junction DNA helicase RuvA